MYVTKDLTSHVMWKFIIAFFTFKKILDVFNLFLNLNHKCICVCIHTSRCTSTYSPISDALEYIKNFFFAKSCNFWDLGSPTRD